MTQLTPVTEQNTEAVKQLLHELPDGDLAFLKEPIDDDAVNRWSGEEHTHRWVAVSEEGEPQAILSIVPGSGWSSHVGELRLIVGVAHRRLGLGRRLARYGLAEAVRLGLEKVVVEVVADKEGDVTMFTAIGFVPEALLHDQIRDREGQVHDLVLLAHDVGEFSASLDVLGLSGDLQGGGRG